MSSNDSTPSPLGRYRQLAPTASVRVSPLCLGAMTLGRAHSERYGEVSKETAFEILDHFYENGGNFIDTANVYRDGESEQWLGEWMAARGNRDEIVLATKYSNLCQFDPAPKISTNTAGNGTKSMRQSLEASLRRLQTSYVDILYVHYWDYATSIAELMHGLNDLVVAGKVHYLGISDTPAWIVTKANQYARDHGLRPFVVYQGMWNAAMRDFERDILPMCLEEGMALCPYGTLNQGRFQTEAGFREREKHNPGRNFIPTSDRDKQVSKVLEQVACSRGVDIPQIALSYIIHKAPYVFPIVGARKVDHLQGSINGLRVQLSEQEVEHIESAYEFDHGFPHTFLSGTMFDHSRPRTAYHAKDVSMNAQFGPMDWVDSPRPIGILGSAESR
ncbi:hypothetical protein ASPACDRAFT_122437 [Aspergillus aculeatus ATCC 16872]|uniref:NADP-dependent oxidoreductase domain-containing protein n=1 Tax=Aspergillus aculeatus (strain ATCC 16872 / CBS 172.66 / WB 5094) TaxID=690307 RepID=A0A1L9WQW7_ASPA1|nr:uncharacterized protein ASPACDRAFT_122437 [Aspergillus aculeatus ATCC 16872]OJJ98575.1 hypothetical protein ASPACDRAFT_122437 [Aspergillus aculeatus ATCC 16872]